MAEQILVLGKSGSGKSTAIESLDPKTTGIINIVGKALPFKGWAKNYNLDNSNYIVTQDYPTVHKAIDYLEGKNKEVIIIDDAQYLMSGEFMDKVNIQGWDKYNSMASNFYKLIQKIKKSKCDIIILTHLEENEQGKQKIKTIGKLLDDKIVIEGLFTIVLYAEGRIEGGKVTKHFRTQALGDDTCKSPRGMFDLEIPNDLKYVLDKVKEYNQ